MICRLEMIHQWYERMNMLSLNTSSTAMEAVAIQSTLLPRDKTTFNEANVCVGW
jgi:hypothetical protein